MQPAPREEFFASRKLCELTTIDDAQHLQPYLPLGTHQFFDANKWLYYYRYYTENNDPRRTNLLVYIMWDTIQNCHLMHTTNNRMMVNPHNPQTHHDYNHYNVMNNGSDGGTWEGIMRKLGARNVVYGDDDIDRITLELEFERKFEETQVFIDARDCLHVASDLRMKHGYDRVLLLNMANQYTVGGGVEKGSRAQEESLMRRSDYFLFLKPLQNSAYPMDDYGAVYTPGVTVFRDSETNGCAYLSHYFQCDMIAVAARRNPELDQSRTYFSRDSAKEYLQKVETIFKVALAQGIDCLILSALGWYVYTFCTIYVSQVVLQIQ